MPRQPTTTLIHEIQQTLTKIRVGQQVEKTLSAAGQPVPTTSNAGSDVQKARKRVELRDRVRQKPSGVQPDEASVFAEVARRKNVQQSTSQSDTAAVLAAAKGERKLNEVTLLKQLINLKMQDESAAAVFQKTFDALVADPTLQARVAEFEAAAKRVKQQEMSEQIPSAVPHAPSPVNLGENTSHDEPGKVVPPTGGHHPSSK